MYSERTQVLLSKQQLARLKRIARRDGRSVGAIIRQAIDTYTTSPPDRRRDAIERLFALDAPIDDWSVMKDEIARGKAGGR
jgi:hypothetical protein